MPFDGIERRSEPRRPYHAPINFILKGKEDRMLRGAVNNISMSGMGMYSFDPLRAYKLLQPVQTNPATSGRKVAISQCGACPFYFSVGKYIMCLLILVVLFVVVPASPSFGMELKTNYATITYDREEQLLIFNKGVSFRDLSYRQKNVKTGTVRNEVRNKLDAIVEKAEMILHMFPQKLKFNIVLLNKDTDVWASYKLRYGTSVYFIAYYSLQNKTIYISADDVSVQILAHELAHAIVDQYYCNTYNPCVLIPVAVHEALAQLVEYNIE